MADEKLRIPYKVRDRKTGDLVYLEANNRAQAYRFASYNRFEVAPLTVREALWLKPEDLLDATKDPEQTDLLEPAAPDPAAPQTGATTPETVS